MSVILVVDNYDSFVYNIVQTLPVDTRRIVVRRNDDVTANDVARDELIVGAIISPGPMTPLEAGSSNEIIVALGRRGVPVLGICLGHQCIAHAFGATVTRHPVPTHGKSSAVRLLGDPLFEGLPEVVELGRYHSLHVEAEGLARRGLEVIAWNVDDGTVMAIRHVELPVVGVQFHPESVLSGESGRTMLKNFAAATA